MENLACLNGEIMPVDQAKVPIWDRGFLFGDSVYEVYRIYDRRCWLEDEHSTRLRRSLREMDYPPYDFESLIERVRRTIEISGVREGTAYIQITRGVAPRLHAFPNPAVPPTELIVIREYDDGPTAKLRKVGVPVISHRDLRWKRCDVKSTNLLANVLANEAAHRADAYEAVLVGEDGFVTEATHSSLIWIRDGRVEGTPEGPGILPGTTRILTLRLAEEIGAAFVENRITLNQLKAADEVILLGTTIEVLPVVTIDRTKVANATPGPLTRQLQEAFRLSLARWLAPVTV